MDRPGLLWDILAGVVVAAVTVYDRVTGRDKPKPLKKRKLWWEK